MPTRAKVTILEHSQAAPPPSTVHEMSHDLTFSDMIFIGYPPVQRIIFYNHPISKIYFIDTIIPNLKNSLSLALKYFPTLAGNCVLPTDSNKPRIRYADGDSVSLVFAESKCSDFDYLINDKARICSEFYPYLPRLSPGSTDSGGARIFPVLAVQVTVFPETGFCIGIEFHHVAADGCAMYPFMKTWAMISKLGEDEASNGNDLLPVYDRAVIKEHTRELDDFYWNLLRNAHGKDDMVAIKFPKPEKTDRVRSTFVISPDDVQRLKDYASSQRSYQKHISTFTVVSGYLWTCMAKVNNVTLGKTDSDETEYFSCPFDFRGRVEPPISSKYFGNSVVECATTLHNGELSGDEGFLKAIERIGEAIEKRCRGVFKGVEKMIGEFAEIINLDRMFWLAGSPRVDYYKMDFGWGKPRKVEIRSIDSTGAICLNGCRDGSQVPEIGVSLPKERMDAFSEIFVEGLLRL